MAEIRTIEGVFAAGEARFALVASRFNSFVVESLVAGAVDTLRRHGVAEAQMTLVRSPGAFELPLVVQKVAASGNYDAIIALGAVILGERATLVQWIGAAFVLAGVGWVSRAPTADTA